ncbi:MAG: hypothetical protein ACTSW1_09675 [Candidatus Hodarchaeales archaeon]
MTESQEHKDLKKLAHLVLYREGFDETEIQEEYVLDESPKRFRVDVVGIRDNCFNKDDNKKVAVELGTTNPKKLIQLELFFDKVIHIPYGIEGVAEIELEQVIKIKEKNENLYNGIKYLKATIKKQNYEIKQFKKDVDYNSKVDDVLRILRIIQSSLVYNKTLYRSLEDSKIRYYKYYREDSDIKHKHIEDIFKLLFKVEKIEFE